MFSTKGGLYERARKKFKISDGIKLFSYPFYKQRRLDVQVGARGLPTPRPRAACRAPLVAAQSALRMLVPGLFAMRGSAASSLRRPLPRRLHAPGLFRPDLLRGAVQPRGAGPPRAGRPLADGRARAALHAQH